MKFTMKWTRVRLILLSTILAGLVAYTGCDMWAGRRVAGELARLEARYGKFEDAGSRPPEIPAPENRARLVSAAAALVNSGTAIERAAVSKFMSDPAPKTVPPELLLYLQSNAQALQLARQFVTRPRSGFNLDYRSASEMPPLLDMRFLSNVIYMATIQSMAARQLDDAAALIEAGLSLSAAARDEPSLIVQLIRINIADVQLDAIQRLIEESDPSKAALERLARALAENREPAPMTVGLMGEVKYVHSVFANLEAGRSNDVASSNLPWPLVGPMARMLRPLVRWAHARYLEQAGVLLALQTGPRPQGPMPDTRNPPPWAFIDRMSHTFTAGLLRAMQSGDDFMSQQAAAELVVALRRFKLDRGAYPDALSSVVPAYLPAVPIDPFTGQAPVYARTGDGFTLTVKRSEIYAQTKRPTPIWKVTR